MLAIASQEKYVVSKYLMLKWLRDKFPGANEIDNEVILDELCQMLRLFILKVLDCSCDGFTERLDGELANLYSKGYKELFASGEGRLYNTPDRYENDWEVLKRGWDAQVLGEIPHKFENVVGEVKTSRKVVEAILDTVEQGDVENADHGNAKDKIQWSPGRIWVLCNVFIHLKDKVKVWATGIDKPQLSLDCF